MEWVDGLWKTPRSREATFLQQHFGVSSHAMLYRLLEVGMRAASDYAACQAESQSNVIRAARLIQQGSSGL